MESAGYDFCTDSTLELMILNKLIPWQMMIKKKEMIMNEVSLFSHYPLIHLDINACYYVLCTGSTLLKSQFLNLKIQDV